MYASIGRDLWYSSEFPILFFVGSPENPFFFFGIFINNWNFRGNMKMTALLKVFDSWEGTAEKGSILHYIGRLGNFSFRLLLIKAFFNDFPPHVNVNL